MVSLTRRFLAALLTLATVFSTFAESKTTVSDPNAVNGAVSYVYGPVGNRRQKTSTLPGYPGGLSNYNANDELTTDSYDAKLLDGVYTMNKYDPLKRPWRPGTSFIPDPLIKLDALTFAIVDPAVGGVIVYSVVNAGEIYFLAAIAVKSMVPQLETETGTALTLAAEGGF